MVATNGGSPVEAREGAFVDDAVAIEASLRRPEAFTAVFDRHFDAISSFARRRVGSDAAEEIVSETFTRAFHQRSRYDLAYVSARPWLLGIASNLLRRHWRDESARLAAYSRMTDEPGATPEPSAPVSPELLTRLGQLPLGQREVLLLYALADLTYDEIARALGIRVGTVRSRLSRARRALSGEQSRLSQTEPKINTEAEECSSA